MERLTARLNSSAALSAAMASNGWAADFRQLDHGREDMILNAATCPGLLLVRVELCNRIHQRALPPEQSVTFGLPTRPQAPARMGRRSLESESLTCFHPTRGLDVVNAPRFSAYTLTFATERMSQLAEATRMVDPALDQAKHGQQCRPDAVTLARLRAFLQQIFLINAQSDPRLIANARASIASDLALEVLQALNVSKPEPYVKASNRSRALKRVLVYIEERPREVITVEELCRESACSISTLERAFREQFGISPKHYLTAVRLNGVRQDLHTNETASIGDLAAQWGFWHMSKFASDYKRMFHELPSQTRTEARISDH